MVTGLSYEELILLQEIMIDLEKNGLFIDHDSDVFDSLYEKIIAS